MNPYKLNAGELKIIIELQNKKLSPYETWKDDSVKELKSKIKNHYIKEQKQKCAYCKVDLHTSNNMVWDTEHIIDKKSFPQWIFETQNLCVSCKDCNNAKGITPSIKSSSYKEFPCKKENYRIIHPHFDIYEDHIEVALPGVTYRYFTEKGKITIEVCGLLRYHKAGGRKDIDPVLQALLRHAADNQTPEAFKAVELYVLSKRGSPA